MDFQPSAGRLPLLIVAAVLAGAVAGCPEKSDLGNQCRVMLPDGDGGLALVPNTSSVLNPKFDFVSTGDTDCENLVCVRQIGVTASDANGNALGICSTPCVDNTDCAPTSNGLQCLQLAFDQSFLNALQANNPALFNQFFGSQASATFCVQPSGQ